MSRRRKSVQREILPDPRYKDLVLAKFVRALMIDGKKNTAEKLIYSSLTTKKTSQILLKKIFGKITNSGHGKL